MISVKRGVCRENGDKVGTCDKEDKGCSGIAGCDKDIYRRLCLWFKWQEWLWENDADAYDGRADLSDRRSCED